MFESAELPQDLPGLQKWCNALSGHYEERPTEEFLRDMITGPLAGRIALVSSFGADSAVLLHLVSRIAPEIPVRFLDTGKHFGETLRYRDQLRDTLGLSSVTSFAPDARLLESRDKDGMLFFNNANLCCQIRKVEPLERALSGFSAWISGRKRHQAETREQLPLVELDGERVKLNPLANWSRDQIDDWFETHNLPRHPLEEDGFLSIGCMPCTERVAPGDDRRSGRWRGQEKTECGIHSSSSRMSVIAACA